MQPIPPERPSHLPTIPEEVDSKAPDSQTPTVSPDQERLEGVRAATPRPLSVPATDSDHHMEITKDADSDLYTTPKHLIQKQFPRSVEERSETPTYFEPPPGPTRQRRRAPFEFPKPAAFAEKSETPGLQPDKELRERLLKRDIWAHSKTLMEYSMRKALLEQWIDGPVSPEERPSLQSKFARISEKEFAKQQATTQARMKNKLFNDAFRDNPNITIEDARENAQAVYDAVSAEGCLDEEMVTEARVSTFRKMVRDYARDYDFGSQAEKMVEEQMEQVPINESTLNSCVAQTKSVEHQIKDLYQHLADHGACFEMQDVGEDQKIS